jgi:hypothetical protein
MQIQEESVLHFFFIAFIALTAYLAVPGAGAFYVRGVWRQFRRTMTASVLFRPLTYADLHFRDEEWTGPCRFYGTIRAIQGEDRIWCSNGRISVSVDLRGTRIYLLSSTIDEERIYARHSSPEEPPRRISWKRLSSLPEYTKVYIAGVLRREKGTGVFSRREDLPLLVIIYEQEDEALLRQAVWRGRQRNEYWNLYTPGSLVVGSFSLFLYFYLLVQRPLLQLPALAALTLSLAPILPLLPPALFFVILYMRNWRTGRVLRAERDLLRISTLYFNDGIEIGEEESVRKTRLPTGEQFLMLRMENKREVPAVFPEGRWIDLSISKRLIGREYYIFGVSCGENSNELRLCTPRDPAAEGLIVPGNPFFLAKKCEARARHLEAVGLSLFVAGALINGFLAFAALRTLLY